MTSATHTLVASELQADPLADDTMGAILGPWPAAGMDPDALQWQRIQQVNRVFDQWTDNASVQGWVAPDNGSLDPATAQALRRYLDQATTLPEWADPRQIARAEQLFMDHGAMSCVLLFCASLPECYVIPDLSSVLHTAGQLEQHTEHRIRSTAAMIFPVMMRGGLTRPDGAGIAQVLKVRLIHATIRNLILRGTPAQALDAPAVGIAPLALPAGGASLYQALFARGWNTARDGLPCNQEELAYTLLTFGYVFLRGMRRLGLGLTRADEEAYLHAWNVVGAVLGIDPGLMVHTMDDGARLMDEMQARGRAQPVTPDPRPALAAALMNTMAQSLPWAIVRPFPLLLTRYLCGPATSRDLGLDQQPVSWPSRLLFWMLLLLARGLDAVVGTLLPRFSITRVLMRVLGYHWLSRVLMSQTRPLRLPDALLQQVDDTVDQWSDDAHAPGWLSRLEDRLTTAGSWSARLARRPETA